MLLSDGWVKIRCRLEKHFVAFLPDGSVPFISGKSSTKIFNDQRSGTDRRSPFPWGRRSYDKDILFGGRSKLDRRLSPRRKTNPDEIRKSWVLADKLKERGIS